MRRTLAVQALRLPQELCSQGMAGAVTVMTATICPGNGHNWYFDPWRTGAGSSSYTGHSNTDRSNTQLFIGLNCSRVD